ncbi:OprO/OprP family phosphate-selective porin [Sphingopyxis sp. MWB1]|uniref:OprO/OprP family phosphate-selective porin n=1 Tax=Sphingopyxis sp. MWB1 TaxID=1537715 RepID=UPI00068F6B90|nr:OprO/OprP family phosphate-selective porin [Sphingopyxis sp. MWB1]
MRLFLTAALMGTTSLCLSSPAFAQPMSAEEAEALRGELAALKAQVAALEERLDRAADRPAPVASVGMAPASTPSAVAPAAQARPATEIGWKGAPELKSDSGWSFKPRGRILIDAGHVSAPEGISDPALGFSNEIRRARLGVEGTMPGGFGYKLEADFAEGDAELTDAHLTYKHGPFKITVGQHNNFQGLEELSSSNDTSFIERAAFTDAFGFERRIGVSGEYGRGDILVQAGVFTDNASDLGDSGNSSVSLDGRLVYAPKLGETQLHFGTSAHWRNLGDTVTSVRYRQRPLVHSADIRFISTPSIGAKGERGLGAEAAFIRGRFHGAAEAFWQTVERPGQADPTFFGGAIEAGLFLTDDRRGYRDGMFKGVKVKNPVGSGGLGAWQVNLRYDRLDLDDAGIDGGKQNGYMASLIWTPIDYLRFMINYARLDYRGAVIPAGTDRNYGVDVVGMRGQIVF